MKKRIFASIMCIFLMVSLWTFSIPVSAEEVQSETSTEEYDTDTYYYDRISDEARIIYDFLKEYYPTIYYDQEKEDFYDRPQVYIPTAQIIPGMTQEYYENDFIIDCILADDALKLDLPYYEIYGMVSSLSSESVSIASSQFNYDEELFTARIRQIVDTVGEGDRYTKLRKLVSYMMDNVVYDMYSLALPGHICNGRLAYDVVAYGTIVKGVGVCDGMSRALKILCDELDIPCIIMGSVSHGWNLVQMDDGRWYDVDLTNVCPIGQDGTTWDKEDYFSNYFLSNTEDERYKDPYNLALNNIRYVTDFPEAAPYGDQYKYTGDTTDFSYVEVPMEEFSDKYQYRVNGDGRTCVITHFVGKQSGDLIIPSSIDGYTVTGIDAFAFYCNYGFDGKLVIPETVRYIGEGAFISCYALKSVEFHNSSVEHIGQGAFVGCKGMGEIVLPNSILEIKDYAFYDCDSLESVSFGSHIEFIDDTAFEDIDNDVVFKAPNGSIAEDSAIKNGFSFISLGDPCTNQPADDAFYYENFADNHYHFCECGAKIYDKHVLPDIEDPYAFYGCGNMECIVCGALYCYTDGFIYPEDWNFTVVEPIPGDCHNGEFTGGIECQCGRLFGGGYTNIYGDHVLSSDEWCYDENVHYKLCDYGCHADEENHCGGYATATKRAQCDVCGAEYGDYAQEETTIKKTTEEETTIKETTIKETTEDETIEEEMTEEETTEEETIEEETTIKETTESVTDLIGEENTSGETSSNDMSGFDATALGCGGFVSGAYVLIVLASTIGFITLKKKRQ